MLLLVPGGTAAVPGGSVVPQHPLRLRLAARRHGLGPLALAGSDVQYSPAILLGGANALDLTVVMIGSAGAIQLLFQSQVSQDGVNWSDAGSSHQVLAYGNSVSSAVTGVGFRYFRIAVQNQTANTAAFVAVARLYCN